MRTSLRQKPPRVGVIGFGAIAGRLVEELSRLPAVAEIAAVLVRPARVEETASQLSPSVAVVSAVHELEPLGLDLVVECAGQQSVVELGAKVLTTVSDLAVIATGALVDDAFRETLLGAARDAGRRVIVPAGAIAGIDGLNALRLGGLDHVRYISTKPPRAWLGSPAEDVHDLARLFRPTIIFEGPAREAARLYPKNANLAATVALAGIGLDRTEVVLIADPAATGNTGRIEADGRHGRLRVEMAGPAAAGNAKTSSITSYSILHAIENLDRAMVL